MGSKPSLAKDVQEAVTRALAGHLRHPDDFLQVLAIRVPDEAASRFASTLRRVLTEDQVRRYRSRFGQFLVEDLIILLQRLHSLMSQAPRCNMNAQAPRFIPLDELLAISGGSYAQVRRILQQAGIAGTDWANIVPDQSVSAWLKEREFHNVRFFLTERSSCSHICASMPDEIAELWRQPRRSWLVTSEKVKRRSRPTCGKWKLAASAATISVTNAPVRASSKLTKNTSRIRNLTRRWSTREPMLSLPTLKRSCSNVRASKLAFPLRTKSSRTIGSGVRFRWSG